MLQSPHAGNGRSRTAPHLLGLEPRGRRPKKGHCRECSWGSPHVPSVGATERARGVPRGRQRAGQSQLTNALPFALWLFTRPAGGAPRGRARARAEHALRPTWLAGSGGQQGPASSEAPSRVLDPRWPRGASALQPVPGPFSREPKRRHRKRAPGVHFGTALPTCPRATGAPLPVVSAWGEWGFSHAWLGKVLELGTVLFFLREAAHTLIAGFSQLRRRPKAVMAGRAPAPRSGVGYGVPPGRGCGWPGRRAENVSSQEPLSWQKQPLIPAGERWSSLDASPGADILQNDVCHPRDLHHPVVPGVPRGECPTC